MWALWGQSPRDHGPLSPQAFPSHAMAQWGASVVSSVQWGEGGLVLPGPRILLCALASGRGYPASVVQGRGEWDRWSHSWQRDRVTVQSKAPGPVGVYSLVLLPLE